MERYERWAWRTLTFGGIALLIEVIWFCCLTSPVLGEKEFTINAVQVTSAIGSFIGGTAGLIVSLCSVLFFCGGFEVSTKGCERSEGFTKPTSIRHFFV